MSADHVRPIFVAILGSDALLASRPHDPVQLTRACRSAGFDLAVPVTWGEEVIATQIAARLASKNGATSVVAAVCPRVIEQQTRTPLRTPALQTVAPPVATARYVRAAFRPRRVHVTYVGACPGADTPEIDVHCLPETFFARLVDSGIDVARQARHLDDQLPVERARYASVAGGVPENNWLIAHAGARVVNAAPITADVVTQVYPNEALLIDLAVACKCVCARERAAVARLEPPRSIEPVVADLQVCVFDEPEPSAEGEFPTADAIQPVEEDRRAAFAEDGLPGEAPTLPPGPETLSRAIEPW